MILETEKTNVSIQLAFTTAIWIDAEAVVNKTQRNGK
jgi:hypothetical protein